MLNSALGIKKKKKTSPIHCNSYFERREDKQIKYFRKKWVEYSQVINKNYLKG